MNSVLITVRPSDVVGEFDACMGIDVQSPGPAPDGECLRVDIRLYDEGPLAFAALDDAVRSLKPFLIGRILSEWAQARRAADMKVTLSKNATELEASLGPVHRRVLQRIRSWQPPPHIILRDFYRYLLSDPEAIPSDVMEAVSDLMDREILLILEIKDMDFFRRELEIVVSELENERGIS